MDRFQTFSKNDGGRCEEHPEAKYYEESHKELPQRLMEIDIGKLLDGLAELDRQKEEILNDEKLNAIWDEMGYEPLSSVLETEGLRNANKNHREKDWELDLTQQAIAKIGMSG